MNNDLHSKELQNDADIEMTLSEDQDSERTLSDDEIHQDLQITVCNV